MQGIMSTDQIGSGTDQSQGTKAAPQGSATFVRLVDQAADAPQSATHTPRNGLRPPPSLDEAYTKKGNQPTAAKQPMPNVLITSAANRRVWRVLKPYMPVGTCLTNVYRSPQHQLDIIVERATALGYVFKEPPVVNHPRTWLEAWKLVNTHGDPVARPGQSMHERGLAYDLAGANLKDIMEGIMKAAADGRIKLLSARNGWPNPRLEGSCVHVEIEGATLDFEPFAIA